MIDLHVSVYSLGGTNITSLKRTEKKSETSNDIQQIYVSMQINGIVGGRKSYGIFGMANN